MQENDFSEALGRLLTDGHLRDAFAIDPEKVIPSLCPHPKVQSELALLKINELEAQAEVLLRKRFEAIKRIIPETLFQLGIQAWPIFHRYGRYRWLQIPEDALGFIDYVRTEHANKIDSREVNRLVFALGTSPVCFHWICLQQRHPALQILVRFPKKQWKEWVLFLSL